MSIQFPSLNLDPNIQGRTAMNSALATLQGVNQARAQWIQNQASQAQLPYAGPQAQANLGLTQAQTGLVGAQAQYYPYTAAGTLLSGIGRAIPALQPGSFLRNYPEALKEQLSANQVQGQSNLGAIPIPNYSPLLQGVGNLVGNLLGIRAPQNALATPGGNGAAAALSGGAVTSPVPPQPVFQPTGGGAQDVSNSSLTLSPQQMATLKQNENQIMAPGSDAQANEVAANLRQEAQNQVAAPSLQQKYNYAKNVAQTFKTIQDNFGVPAITFAPYMGAEGAVRLKKDQALAASGQNVPLYNQYLAFERQLPILKGQLTQFYGGSVSPRAQEELDEVLNPVTMTANPQSGMQAYNTLQDIMRTEGLTAAKTVGKTNEYNQLFPEFDAPSFYKQLSVNPQSARDIYQVLTPSQQQALLAYHQLKKKGEA